MTPKNFIDLIGQQFGRLIVLERVTRTGTRVKWRCRCECGTEKVVQGNHLREGNIRSCGCLQRETRTTHGYSNPKIRPYRIWQNMRQRCENPNTPCFPNYGGRGITVCERWQKFENFFADMGNPPEELTLERIDNDGKYEPGNCRWATRKEQLSNSRHNRMISHNGETLTLSQWAQKLNITYQALQGRLRRWRLEDALTPRT